jgi:hypothetical protein
MTRPSVLIRVVVGVAALGVLAVLFLRSAQSAREAPFSVQRGSLTPWTLVLEPGLDAVGSWLALRPPPQLASPLGRQIFTRAGESVHYPNPPSLPLVLRSEFDRALAGTLTPDAVMNVARAAGLESATFEPRCMAHRRISEPGATRGVYFLLFDAPAFDQFRRQVSEELRRAGGNASLFDPAALSPVLIVAAIDENFSRWLPLRANPDADCLAPIEVQ